VRGLFVTRDRQQLHARIEANVAAMFARGVEEEVAALPEQATGPTAAMTLGLREIRALLKGDITRLEAMIAITTATRRYAKRQITWFKNQHSFPLLNLTEFASERMLDESLRLLFKKRVARC
jgi:tRNA dimethylallyltransferase